MSLKECREKIDAIDEKILDLFVERMETSLKIAEEKAALSLPVLDRGRERDVLLRAVRRTGKFGGYARVLYNTIFDLSRSCQRGAGKTDSPVAALIRQALQETPKFFPSNARVACQGVEGAYSQQACDRILPLADIVYVRNFAGVFHAVEQGLCEYGILPIENSCAGTVREVYDLMAHHHFYIVRSVKLQIHHRLLTLPGVKLDEIREIVSHPQAIAQCRDFLDARKDVRISVCENTAAAAKLTAESGRRDLAAIASEECARLYGLSCAADSVQNSDNNNTRFICIAKTPQIYHGANRISLMLKLPHKPGALYSIISKCAALGLNLTKLESRPIPGRDFEFMFYCDLNAPVDSPEVLQLLGELQSDPDDMTFLGAYCEF